MEKFTVKIIYIKDLPFYLWDDIPDRSILTVNHIGVRVYVAGYNKRDHFILIEIHKKGDKYWEKYDGCTVRGSDGIIRHFMMEQCRLHPDEIKRIKKKDRDLKNKIKEEKRNHKLNKKNKNHEKK